MKLTAKAITIFLSVIFSVGLFISCSDKNDEPSNSDNKLSENLILISNNEAKVYLFAEQEEVFIPSTYTVNGISYPVTAIGNKACNEYVKILHLPSSIKKIDYNAFTKNNITSLYIEDLESWCNIEFEYSEYYSPGTRGNSIGTSANPLENHPKFYVNGNLVEELVIPSSITAIKPMAFQGLKAKTVIFPENLESIGDGSFQLCILDEINIPKNLKYVGFLSFELSSIKTVRIGDGIKKFNVDAFNSSSLSEVYFGKDITLEGSRGFNYIDTPWTLYLEGTFDNHSFRGSAFRDSHLRCVDAIDLQVLIQSGFLNNEQDNIPDYLAIGGEILSSLDIPAVYDSISLTNIKNIKTVNFEDGIETLDQISYLQDVKQISFPSTLIKIERFDNCPMIADIYCSALIPPIIDNAIENCNLSECRLHVSSESIDLYRKAPGWNVFYNITD